MGAGLARGQGHQREQETGVPFRAALQGPLSFRHICPSAGTPSERRKRYGPRREAGVGYLYKYYDRDFHPRLGEIHLLQGSKSAG